MAAFAVDAFSPRRVLAATLVLVLHAVLIALLLRATLFNPSQQQIAREHVYWLTLNARPKIATSTVTPPQHARARSRRKTRAIKPAAPGAPSVATPGEHGLSGLHLNLFGCALENLANLSPEERAQCELALKRYDDKSVDFADHTNRSKSAQLWARRLAQRQNPPLLPCMSPAAASPLYTLYCLGKGALTGFNLDSMPGYGDKPPPPDHLPNNGDPDPRAHRN